MKKPFGLQGFYRNMSAFKALTTAAWAKEQKKLIVTVSDVGSSSSRNHLQLTSWLAKQQQHGEINESGFRPPLCTYRLNWARRTSWGWWDDWDDTVLQTQDSKFEPWRSEAEHATSRSRRLPTILTFTREWGKNFFFFSNRRDREPNPELWRESRGANHYPRAPAQQHGEEKSEPQSEQQRGRQKQQSTDEQENRLPIAVSNGGGRSNWRHG